VPDGKGEQGGGTGFREQEYLESGGGQHAGAELCKLRRVVARVARDHTRTGVIASLVSRHIVGQAAGALGDRPFVEHIRADRVHHASPSAGAEFEDREERVVEDFPPALVDVLKQSRPVMGKRGLGQPAANCGRGRGGKL